MKNRLLIILLAASLAACHKDKKEQPSCDMEKAYTDNAAKVTITNGVWGTVAFQEGNCMPMIGPGSTCKTCPVKRTVRIYEYTMRDQATPANKSVFYESFSTQLIKEVTTDDNGFYQTEIPAGHYTIVIVEDGKLYAAGMDGQGGLNPITVTTGKMKVDLTLRYKAVY